MTPRHEAEAAVRARASGVLLVCAVGLAAAACGPAEDFQVGPLYSNPPQSRGPATASAGTGPSSAARSGHGAASRPGSVADAETTLHRRLEKLNTREPRAVLRLLEVYGAALPPRSSEALDEMANRLTAALKSERPGVRRGAAAALGQIDPRALRGDPFTALFVDPDAGVRREAVLAHVRQGIGSVWVHVLNLSQDRDPEVRAAAATALGTVQHDDVTVRLVQLLSDPDAQVVTAAGGALSDSLAGETPQAIFDCLRSDRAEVRLAAARVLAAARGAKAADALVPLLDDSNWQVRHAAIRGLTGIDGEPGARATWALIAMGEHVGRPQSDRLEAIQALARTRRRPDLEQLERLTRKEADPVLRLALARTLLAWGDLRSLSVLVDLTECASDDPGEQRTASRVRSLAEQTIRDAFDRSDEPLARAAAAGDPSVVRTRTWREKLPELLGQAAGRGVAYSPSDLSKALW